MVGPEDPCKLAQPGAARERWMRRRTVGGVFTRVRETPDFHRETDRLLPALRALAEV